MNSFNLAVKAYQKAISEHYEELDATIFNCMAAGVSIDQFIFTEPRVSQSILGNIGFSSYIGFKPELRLTK